MMTDTLSQICAVKREEIAHRKSILPYSEVAEAATQASPPRGFAAALAIAAEKYGYGLIAEIKQASPSKGLIRETFDPPELAQAYQRGGATCLSVLTDTPFFQGTDGHLRAARAAVDLPVLRKDFMLDPYQIIESRALGADCVLLIMAALQDEEALRLDTLAHSLGMDTLIEVHNEQELERALALTSHLIGINNRDLKTLKTDLATTPRLAKLVPEGRMLVAESGIHSHADLVRMSEAGASAFLIGEALMSQDDVEAATRAMLGRADEDAVRKSA